MAACCEVLAFGLGSLTSMPAVRNFSICAALAVLLDFLLQVTTSVCVWFCVCVCGFVWVAQEGPERKRKRFCVCVKMRGKVGR